MFVFRKWEAKGKYWQMGPDFQCVLQSTVLFLTRHGLELSLLTHTINFLLIRLELLPQPDNLFFLPLANLKLIKVELKQRRCLCRDVCTGKRRPRVSYQKSQKCYVIHWEHSGNPTFYESDEKFGHQIDSQLFENFKYYRIEDKRQSVWKELKWTLFVKKRNTNNTFNRVLTNSPFLRFLAALARISTWSASVSLTVFFLPTLVHPSSGSSTFSLCLSSKSAIHSFILF